MRARAPRGPKCFSPLARGVALVVFLASPGPRAFAQRVPAGPGVLVRRPFDGGAIVLRRSAGGDGDLTRIDAAGVEHPVSCERLPGAWGVWLDDVDGDGRTELLIALRKRARFDPVSENRLHVYALASDRCVPMWRGTRLAGRFDWLAIEPGSPGPLLVWERVGHGVRRLARYRWVGFGFSLERVLWLGPGALPPRLERLLDR